MDHAIECAPTETPSNSFYVRTDIDGQTKDKRFTDLGFTTIGTEGMQSTSEVGGLWVTYDISFLKPILNPQNAVSDGFDNFVCQTADGNSLYDFKATLRNNYLGGRIESMTGSMTYHFDAQISSGTFLVIWEFPVSPSGTLNDFSGGTYGNLVNAEYVLDDDKNGPFNNGYGPVNTNPISASNSFQETKLGGTEAIVMYMVTVTGPDANIGFTNVTLSQPAPMVWRLSVYPISYKNTPQVLGP
jgi:hypothetical protein